jgi:hypothetical protein
MLADEGVERGDVARGLERLPCRVFRILQSRACLLRSSSAGPAVEERAQTGNVRRANGAEVPRFIASLFRFMSSRGLRKPIEISDPRVFGFFGNSRVPGCALLLPVRWLAECVTGGRGRLRFLRQAGWTGRGDHHRRRR